jgi:hypothetical protein
VKAAGDGSSSRPSSTSTVRPAATHPLGELSHQRRLADTAWPAQEQHPTVATQHLVEGSELLLPSDKGHVAELGVPPLEHDHEVSRL